MIELANVTLAMGALAVPLIALVWWLEDITDKHNDK